MIDSPPEQQDREVPENERVALEKIISELHFTHTNLTSQLRTVNDFFQEKFNYSTFLAQPGLYLEDLFVQPEFRGHGTGKALLLHLAKIANARGCGRMEWSVLDWNEPALGFYRKLGARQLDDWRICRLAGAALAQYA